MFQYKNSLNVYKWKLFSCFWLCDPMDYSLPGSSVHGTLQAKILEWVAVPFSTGSSQPRNQPRVTCVAGRFLMSWATRETLKLAAKLKWEQPILWIVLVLRFRSAQSRMVAASHMWLFKIKFKLNMTKFWFPCCHISCAYQSFVARGYCRGHLR